MKGFFYRIYCFYFSEIRDYIRGNLFKIILGVLFILFSILVGILTCYKFVGDIETGNIINWFIVKIISNDIGLFTAIFIQILLNLVIVSILLLFPSSFIFFLLKLLFIFVICYIVGFDICAICVLFGMCGVVYNVIIVPIILIILFSYYL